MKIKVLFSAILVSFGLLLGAQPASAFGPNGHRIVAQIGENHLTPKAAAEIRKITGGQYLAQLATWPDEIRSDPSWDWVKPWHFLSIDDNESFDDFPRSPEGDVWSALERFEKQLRARQKKDGDGITLKQALAFYIHFVGDIHQPLHVGRPDDAGGNFIKVQWFDDTNSNLHKVWDEGLINHEGLSFREYAEFLDQAPAFKMHRWQNSTYLDWAKESKAVRYRVYDFGKQDANAKVPKLSYSYVFHNHPLIGERMLKAGVRLAGMLNAIFDKKASPKKHNPVWMYR